MEELHHVLLIYIPKLEQLPEMGGKYSKVFTSCVHCTKTRKIQTLIFHIIILTITTMQIRLKSCTEQKYREPNILIDEKLC